MSMMWTLFVWICRAAKLSIIDRLRYCKSHLLLVFSLVCICSNTCNIVGKRQSLVRSCRKHLLMDEARVLVELTQKRYWRYDMLRYATHRLQTVLWYLLLHQKSHICGRRMRFEVVSGWLHFRRGRKVVLFSLKHTHSFTCPLLYNVFL